MARHEPDVVGSLHEVDRARLEGPLALQGEREDLDPVTEALELKDLIQDERLSRLGKTRHQVGETERPRRRLVHRVDPDVRASSAYRPA